MIDIETHHATSEFQQVQRRSSAWLWQAGSGVALPALLTPHLVANHFVVDGGLRDHAKLGHADDGGPGHLRSWRRR